MTKKPGVTRTTGWVMGETQIWLTNFVLTSPTYGVNKCGSDLHHTIEKPSCCRTNESNEVSFVESGRVMGISRKDHGPRRSLRGFFFSASVADVDADSTL